MWLYKDTIMVVKNISNETQRVSTLDWKQDIKKGKTFETTEKEANQLVRMYWYLFKIVGKNEPEDETNTDTDDTNTNDTENTSNTNDVETSEWEENVDWEETQENDIPEDDIPEEEKILIEMREAYKKKYNQEVPVNKKNDINRIKSKL